MYKDPFRAARALGKRSGLEVRIAKELDAQGVIYTYEEHTVRYTQPEKNRRYTPDIILQSGIVIELKGQWDSADRAKIAMVKEQHPDLDLRFVFNNPNARISKQSKTTYAMVCEKLGIPYAKGSVPVEWLQEPGKWERWAAIEKACSAN